MLRLAPTLIILPCLSAQAAWTQLAPIAAPPKRTEIQMHSDGTGALMFGGQDGTIATAYNDLWRFDVETRTWTQHNPGGARPQGRFNASLVYAPELFRAEFKSEVADMKNSVKNRANAGSSCAGQFIANHLPKDAPRWLHIDIAGPAWAKAGRGSGYGVGLLLELGAGPDPK